MDEALKKLNAACEALRQRIDQSDEGVDEAWSLLKASSLGLDLISKLDTIVPMIQNAPGTIPGTLPPTDMNAGPSSEEPHEADAPEEKASPVVGASDLLSYIYGAMLDEVKAVSIYDALAQVSLDEPTKTLLLHIRDEEMDHIEELKQIVVSLQRLSGGGGERALSLGQPQQQEE